MQKSSRTYIQSLSTLKTICKNKTSTVRNDAGDKGQMYALGCRLYPKEKGIISYVGNKHVSHILPNAVQAMEYFRLYGVPKYCQTHSGHGAGCWV
jgi:ssDNA-binding Zn-finger/Zn-ribbon topoisomerase 1